VLVDFPFSDLSDTKLRPAIILARATAEDWLFCQITSNAGIDGKAIELTDTDFIQGSLRRVSFARPNKIFTGHESLVNRRVGILKDEKVSEITEAVVKIVRNE
jgi:mRNA interferase MazF